MTIERLTEFRSSFTALQNEIYDVAYRNGFHELEGNDLFTPTKLALIISEVVEALEAHRRKKDSDIASELADIVIRTMNLAESLGIDLAQAIVNKHEFNKTRPYKHGDKRY